VYLASSPATINVTGLPTGIAAVNNAGTITISGNAVTPGTYNYSIVLTATCGQLTRTGTIIVNAAPTVAFNVMGPACMERNTLFADASTPNSGTINNWQWNFGDPSGSQNTSTLQNPSHLYTNSGIYQVTLNVTTDKGCVGIPIIQPVTVNKRPNAGFILPEVCLLDPFAQFTDTSRMEAPGTITAWSWNFGDPASGANNTSTAQNAIHTYGTATSFNVQLVATSNVGCTDTVRSQLTVNGGNPVADALVLNAASLCVKDSVAVQNKSSITQGIITKLEIYWDNTIP
ncbi:MAG: PKD domain-containing protein, partial [Pedobacter sp.]